MSLGFHFRCIFGCVFGVGVSLGVSLSLLPFWGYHLGLLQSDKSLCFLSLFLKDVFSSAADRISKSNLCGRRGMVNYHPVLGLPGPKLTAHTPVGLFLKDSGGKGL